MDIKKLWEKIADAFDMLSEKLMLRDLYHKYGKYLLPATAGLIIVAMFTSALILDKGAATEAAAELVELAETLGKDRVKEFKKLQETALRKSKRQMPWRKQKKRSPSM